MTLLHFFSNLQNLMLLALAVVSGGALIMSFVREGRAGLSPSEATQWINRADPVIIDVRTDADYELQHIPRAHHINLNHLKDKAGDLAKWHDKPVLVYCQSGNRSQAAISQLRKQGFKEPNHLKGGLEAWREAGLPLDKGRHAHHKHS